MFKALQYFARFQQFRGQVSTLPGWAVLILFVFALPALVIAALAIVLLGVSILALLLLAVPAYRVLSAVAGRRTQDASNGVWVESQDLQSILTGSEQTAPSRRHIDVKIVE